MRNGAGKTTTMRMILGLDAPTQGTSPSRSAVVRPRCGQAWWVI
jgi:ABC-type multidrug transport system ATPase subunit